MPRKAREKTEYGTFFIEQSCLPEKKIFKSENDRESFLKLLSAKKKQFNFRLYGCCVIDDDKYKLIIYDNGSDISNIMKSINISLVMNLNGGERFFGERYKSTLIKTTDEFRKLYFTLNEHCNCGARFPEIFEPLIDNDIYFTPPGSSRENVLLWDRTTNKFCLEKNPLCQDTVNCIKTLEQGKIMLEKSAENHGIDVEELLNSRKLRNDLLLRFRKTSTLSLRELGDLFGGLSESAVCKIISRNMGS